MSFMLVRLLQQVSAIEFCPEVAPASIPPPGYTDSPGSDGTDRVWMSSHLTMYAKVSDLMCMINCRGLMRLSRREDYG